MTTIGRNADPTLTLDSLIARSEVATVGIDGGGLDDLLGLAVIGRERASALEAAGAGAEPGDDEPDAAEPAATLRRRWLLWTHAWAHPSVLERRKEIAPRLLDFEADDDLTIVERIGDDADAVAALVARVRDAGLLPQTRGIGVDQWGLGGIIEALAAAGIDTSREGALIEGIPQGWKLVGAIKTVERKLAGGELVHSGSRLMAWCVGNAKVVPAGNAIAITKQAAGKAKIDPLMATFNAAALMALNPVAAGGSGIFDFYRAAAAPSRSEAAMVRLRAPPGVSNVYGMTGRNYMVAADGIVQVAAEDAAPLAGQGFAAI